MELGFEDVAEFQVLALRFSCCMDLTGFVKAARMQIDSEGQAVEHLINI